MQDIFVKRSAGAYGSITVPSAVLVTDTVCEIFCIGTVTFTTLTDSLERSNANYGHRATGTITITSTGPAADETFVVNGLTYTFKVAAADNTEVTINTDPTAQAVLIAAAISSRDPLVTATNVAGVVTIEAIVRGTAGNAYTLTESAANTAVSGAGTFTGGKAVLAASSQSYPAGTVIKGNFTAINLAGGAARLTFKGPE